MHSKEVQNIIELVLDEASEWFSANDPEGEKYFPDYALKMGFGRDEIVQSVLVKLAMEGDARYER